MSTKKTTNTAKKNTKKNEVKAAVVEQEVVATEEIVEQIDVTPVVVTEEIKFEEPAVAEAPKKNKEKKEKVCPITIMDNDTLRKLFTDNNCKAESGAKNSSKVVYQQWGTKSRVLQQGKAYQLLLTNGHKKEKENIVACDNDDVARFEKWYEKLEDKSVVNGMDGLHTMKLSDSEMPRERSVKLTSYNALVDFIKYMATFSENQLVVADK